MFRDKSFSKSSSPPSLRKAPPPSKESSAAAESQLNLTAPFGDPLTKWNTSKQNLLLFGPANYDKSKGTFEHEETQSVSTVSGSGMDFFRKFVQRKGPKQEEPNVQDCKECECQFRREVLIDRLVTDALNSQQNAKHSSSEGSSSRRTTSESSQDSQKYVGTLDGTLVNEQTSDLVARALESSCSSGKCKAHQGILPEDLNSVRSSMSESTVSGSGLLFLRNFMKKKNQSHNSASNDITLVAEDQLNSEATMICDSHQQIVFNTVPIPFPPKDEFYGPAVYIPDDVAFCEKGESRRNSFGSTIADLLNDNFDSEDSELKNLDWDEWEEDDTHQSDFESKTSGTDTDDSSIVVDILEMARPVLPDTRLVQSVASEVSFETDTSEPTYEELKSIKVDLAAESRKKKKKFTIPFLDLPSPPSSQSSGSITPTAEESMSDTRSMLSTPHQDLSSVLSNETDVSFTGARKKETYSKNLPPDAPKKRLAQFWERRVSGNYEHATPSFTTAGHSIVSNTSAESISKFKPAIPSYYDPEGNRKKNEKIQRFLEATRKAADDSSISVWSSNYERLKRGELNLPDDYS